MKTNTTPLLFAALLTAVAVTISTLLVPMMSHAQTTFFAQQMDIGARGEHVSALQRLLATDPAVYPEGIVSGYFGPLTQRAVAQFQSFNGLPSVGRVGPLTLFKLNSLVNGGGMTLDVVAPNILSLNVSTSTSGSAVFSWMTSEPARAKVFYSTNPISMIEASSAATEPIISGTVIADTSLKSNPVINLSNLQSATTYYYVVESIDAAGNVTILTPRVFRTNP